MANSSRLPESGSADASAVKQLRADFESQLLTEGGSTIETWLTKVPSTERAVLFVELLDAEISFQQHRGQKVRPEDYVARFPDLKMQIESVFGLLTVKALQGSDDQTLDSTIDAVPAARTLVKEWTHWKSGDFVGRYRLDTELGQGAFGEVWKGFDPELRRTVAIKLPRKEVLDRFDLMNQFREEARKAASLKHEGIVPVYDIGTAGAGRFIVSEFIDGPTLAQRMKDSRVTIDEAVRIVGQMALTLHQAHRAGLVHRDIKPSNVLLRSDGSPTITDFGLAISEHEQLTATEGVVGTVAYMSPEQARGEGNQVDGRSDIYSLGVILFQMLTGRLPFQFRSSNDLLKQIIQREVRPPRSLDDSIPVELERICLRCLAKDVSQRYSTGRDLAEDLQHWKKSRQQTRWQPKAVLSVTLLATVVGVGFFAINRGRGPPPDVPIPKENEIVRIPQTDKWQPLLNQPVEKVAYVKADSTDDWELNTSKQTLTMRSERNWMILATQQSGTTPLRIRSSVHLNEWQGNVGFAWGIADDLTALPKKQRQCMALIIQRTEPIGPVRLILQRMAVGEMLFDVQWVNSVAEIARTTLDISDLDFHHLELEVRESNIEVFWDRESIWKPTIHDPKQRAALVDAEGGIGLVGHGKSVAFRDAAVYFLTSTKRNNE